MSRLLSFGLAAILSSAAAAAAPNQALADDEFMALPDLVSAAKAICFDHVGEPAAQTAILKADPYKGRMIFTFDEGAFLVYAVGNEEFFDGDYEVSIIRRANGNGCKVATDMDPATTAQDAMALLTPILGAPNKAEGNSAIWARKTNRGDRVIFNLVVGLNKKGDPRIEVSAALIPKPAAQ